MSELRPLDPRHYGAWLARARERMVALRLPGRADAADIVDGLVARLLLDGLDSPGQHVLTGDGAEVWFATGEDPVVLDLAGDPFVVLPEVHEVARSIGTTRMKILVLPGQAELAAATADLGYAPVATRMRSAVPPPRPADRAVVLEPLGADAAAAFVEQLVDSYAADLLSSGSETVPEAARDRARRQTDEALAEPGSVVLGGVVDGEQVGTLWLDVDGDETFVLDIVVAPAHRGRGHGRALMIAAADLACERGCTTIALSVFGDNVVARRLYDSLGYEVTEAFLGVDL